MVVFIAWIIFIRLEQNANLNNKKICENKDVSNIVIPFEDTKILEFNHYQKFVKTPFIIYADLDSLTKKTDGLTLGLQLY